MRRIRLLVVLTTVLFTLATAVSASAATSGGTTATVTVQGGSLSITVPTDAGNLGTRAEHRERRDDQRPPGPGTGERRAQRRRRFRLGRERHLDRVHPAGGPGDRRQRRRATPPADHEGRNRDLHGERPGRPHRRRLPPSPRRGSPATTPRRGTRRSTWSSRRHGRRRLLRDDHALRRLRCTTAAAHDAPRRRRDAVAACSSHRSPAWSPRARRAPHPRARRPAGGIGLRLVDVPAARTTIPERGSTSWITSPRGRSSTAGSRSRTPPPRPRTSRCIRPPPRIAGGLVPRRGRTHPERRCRPGRPSTPSASDVPAGGRATAIVTIAVPSDAAPGERYGVVWAEARSAPRRRRHHPGQSRRHPPLSLRRARRRARRRLHDRLADRRPLSRRPADGDRDRAQHRRPSPRHERNARNSRPGPAGSAPARSRPRSASRSAIGDTEPVTIALDKRLPPARGTRGSRCAAGCSNAARRPPSPSPHRHVARGEHRIRAPALALPRHRGRRVPARLLGLAGAGAAPGRGGRV